ncbi:hypothetical protein DFH08DRAFT_1035418, partial [Mycena albidolilacea]
IPRPKGSGPRHIRISTGVHPVDSVQAIPTAPNGASPTANPRPRSGPPQRSLPLLRASVSTTTSRPATRMYKQTPAGDSITIFENVRQGMPEEKLQLVTRVFAGPDQIRGMRFGGEDDEYLIAEGVAGTAGVVIYRRVDGGRNLTEVARNTDIPTRTSVVWA